jgi:hypothetical protein
MSDGGQMGGGGSGMSAAPSITDGGVGGIVVEYFYD